MDSWHGGYERPGDVPASLGGGHHRKLTKEEFDERRRREAARLGSEQKYLEGRYVLRLLRRKDEVALDALTNGAPTFWSSVRCVMGSEDAYRFKPLSWGSRGDLVLVVVGADDAYARQWMGRDRTQSLRRAEHGDLRDLGTAIPDDVAAAIHLAIFPDGPRAVQEILDHLHSLDGEREGVNPHTGIAKSTPKRKTLGSRPRHVAIPTTHDASPNKRRFAAAVELARIVSDVTTDSDRRHLRIVGVTLAGTQTVVSLSDSPVALSGPLRSRLHPYVVDAPSDIDDEIAGSLHHRFEQVLDDLRPKTVAIRKGTILRPATYRQAVWSGLNIHGVTVILLGLALLLGPWTLASVLSAGMVALAINLGLLPPLLRWGPQAIAGMRDTIPKIGPSTRALPPQRSETRSLAPPEGHWSTLLRLAPQERERIEEARGRCERFVTFAEGRMLDHDATDAVNSVRIHLPEMIANAAALANEARPRERTDVIARTLSVMDAVASAADDARDGLLADVRDRFSTTAGFLEARTRTNLSLPEHRP